MLPDDCHGHPVLIGNEEQGMKHRWYYERIVDVFLQGIFLAIVLSFSLMPLIWMVMTSLKNRVDIFGVVLSFKPTFAAYKNIFGPSGRAISEGIINSLQVALINVFIVLVVGSLAAYALSRLDFKGKNIMFFGVLASRLMPPVVAILPIFLVVRQMGMIDKVVTIGFLNAAFNLPICIWILKSVFDAIPKAIEEAAYIDGANRLQTAIIILFPLSRAGIVTTGLLAFIFSWNEFLISLIFSQKYARTAPIILANATYGEAEIFWADMAALATIIMIPAMLLAFFAQKHLVKGLTNGATK